MIESNLGRTFNPATPSPPLIVTIDGPDEVQEHVMCTWHASASGGTTPYQYEWLRDGQSVSTSSSYETWDTGNSDFLIEVFVMDAANDHYYDYLQVTVEGSGQFQCP